MPKNVNSDPFHWDTTTRDYLKKITTNTPPPRRPRDNPDYWHTIQEQLQKKIKELTNAKATKFPTAKECENALAAIKKNNSSGKPTKFAFKWNLELNKLLTQARKNRKTWVGVSKELARLMTKSDQFSYIKEPTPMDSACRERHLWLNPETSSAQPTHTEPAQHKEDLLKAHCAVNAEESINSPQTRSVEESLQSNSLTTIGLFKNKAKVSPLPDERLSDMGIRDWDMDKEFNFPSPEAPNEQYNGLNEKIITTLIMQ